LSDTERILIAGSGGQGIILCGKILASAGVESFKHVTFFPSYGAEVRGGTSNCQITLSEHEIASPLPEKFDSMLILNQDGYDSFSDMIGDCDLVIINSSLCKSGKRKHSIVPVAATEMADILGDTRVANFIMLGAYIARKSLLTEASVISHISAAMASKSQKISDLNIQAFRTGLTA
jgi:2-oxoglutarate ferredoxin oxidoreductase subunit gamma